MNNSYGKTFFTGILFVVFCIASSCSRHYTQSVESSKTVAAPAQSGDTFAKWNTVDSLAGTWKLAKVESPTVAEKMTGYASQIEREELMDKLKNAQGAFAGLICTFNKDMSYISVYGGETDLGTWRLTRHREIETMSKIKSEATSFKVEYLDSHTLKVSAESTGVILLLTLVKQ